MVDETGMPKENLHLIILVHLQLSHISQVRTLTSEL